MKIETTSGPRIPMKESVKQRIRAKELVCVAFAILIGLAALGFLLVSFRLSYGNIHAQLVQLYGADRTARYFTPAIFRSFMTRLRVGAIVLAVLAVVVFFLRWRLGRLLDLFWQSLTLGRRHESRVKYSSNLLDNVTLGVIVVIGFLLRLRFVNQPMRYDESATVLGYASKPFYLGLSIYNEPNNHLFHTLLVHIAMRIAGSAEWVVRSPALIAGTLLPLLTYGLCRRVTNHVAAIWAAALVAASSILIEYSTNARGYTLICCATLAVLIAGFETLRKASPWWFFILGVAAVVGFWTIPIFLIPFGGTLVWLLWELSLKKSPLFRRLYLIRLSTACVIAGFATALVYLLPIAVNGPNALFRNQWVAPRNLQSFLLGNLVQLRLTWQLWTRDTSWWWATILAIAFLGSVVLYPQLRRLILSLAAWTIFLFAARRFVPFARNWLLFLPIFSMAAAAGLSWILDHLVPRRKSALAAVCALALATALGMLVVKRNSILQSTETGVLKSAPQIADYMASNDIPAEMVFRNSTSDLPLQYYWWRRTGFRPPLPTRQSLDAARLPNAWFLINTTYGETLPLFAKQHGFGAVQVLGEQPFNGAILYHVQIAN